MTGLALLLLAFLGYRYFATRWPPPTVAAPPEVRVVEVAVAAPIATRTPVKEPAAGSDRYIARYDAAGQLVEIKAESVGKAAPASVSGLPISLPASAQGISLERAAQALSGVGALTGATYDPQHRQLLLIGEVGPSSFQPDDLRVAFRAALSHDDPTVSIDPGPKQGEMVVRFSGPVTATHFGMVLFEADRRMKTLALGQDNLTDEPVSASIPGYRTQLDLIQAFEPDSAGKAPSWHRFWFVPKGMRIEESADGQTMRFLDAGLRVLTECMDEQLRPLKNCAAPAANAFAMHLTDHYDAYAADFPVFATLKELAKLVSLAKWLDHRSIPVDQAWLGTEHAAHVAIPATTHAITVSRNITETQGRTVITETYSLYGGVNFRFENSYEPPTSAERMIGQIALDRQPAPDAIQWRVQDGNRELAVVAISLEQETRPVLPMADAMIDLSLGQLGDVALDVIRVPVEGLGALGPGWALDLPALALQPAIRAAPASGMAAQSVPGKLSFRRRLAEASRLFIFRGWTTDGTRIFETEDGREEITWTPAGGYLWKSADGLQQQFDDAGHLRSVTDAKRYQVRYSYEGDALRRIERDGNAWITLAYRSGQLVEARASDGQTRTYEYSMSGHLIGVRDGLGKSLITYEYNAAGYLTAILSSGGMSRRNHYDSDGHLIGFSRDGSTFTYRRAGDGYEITFETPGSKTPAAIEAAQTGTPERITALANELAGQISSQLNEKTDIRQALDALDATQLEHLRSQGAGKRRLYGQMLDKAELDFLKEEASRAMLPGAGSLDINVYGSGDRRLAVYAIDETEAPGRPATIEKLVRHYRLQHQLAGETVISLTEAGATLKVLAGDRSTLIAPQELEAPSDRLVRMLGFLPFMRPRVALTAAQLAERHPERLGRLLESKRLVVAGAPVVGFDGDVTELNFQHAFPAARVYRTQGTDIAAIVRRFQRQRDLKVSLADVAVINGIPTDAVGVTKIEKNPSDTAIWRNAHLKWNAIAVERGVKITSGGASDLIAALQSKPLVPILVAHSNGYTILLPDGSRFDASVLTPEVRQAIATNAPVVWLFSCRTGSIKNGQELVKELLEAGAAGVVAPATDIYAEESADVLGRFLDGIREGRSFLDALDSALKGAGGKWFENHIGRAPSSITSRYAT